MHNYGTKDFIELRNHHAAFQFRLDGYFNNTPLYKVYKLEADCWMYQGAMTFAERTPYYRMFEKAWFEFTHKGYL